MMRDFFRPWNRKLGVVTLALACALALGWIRSEQKCDFVCVNGFGWRLGIESLLDHVRLIRTSPLEASEILTVNSMLVSQSAHAKIMVDGRHELIPIDGERDWRFDWYGFHASHGAYRNLKYLSIFVVPYWAITMPLTLLSAWLLFNRPRTTPAKSP